MVSRIMSAFWVHKKIWLAINLASKLENPLVWILSPRMMTTPQPTSDGPPPDEGQHECPFGAHTPSDLWSISYNAALLAIQIALCMAAITCSFIWIVLGLESTTEIELCPKIFKLHLKILNLYVCNPWTMTIYNIRCRCIGIPPRIQL